MRVLVIPETMGNPRYPLGVKFRQDGWIRVRLEYWNRKSY